MNSSITPDRHEAHRTSFYLVRRADALTGALRFFAEVEGADGDRRRLQFLAQSDFWEWELDNLIYSFTNLAERSETWCSPHAAVAKLGRLGIVVDTKLVHTARWRGRWIAKSKGTRVAPAAMLREVIDLWNHVVDLAEQRFIVPMRRKADRWNLQTRRDLNGLRKRMPDLPAAFTDDQGDNIDL
jgi:hypothetical protein